MVYFKFGNIQVDVSINIFLPCRTSILLFSKNMSIVGHKLIFIKCCLFLIWNKRETGESK